MENTSSFLTDLMRQAGKIMTAAHMEGETGTDVTAKPGTANFVTVYDVAVQDFILRELLKKWPDAVFLAEEQENDNQVLNAPRCFILDPIDGTANFIHNYRHSCISLAMLEQGTTVFGAIYNPYLDEMFCAELNKGATLNGRPIHVSDSHPENGFATFGTSPYYKQTLGEKTFALAKSLYQTMSDVRRSGSAALDLAYLAAGRTDAFFELRLSPWDIAAGTLLIREAGGTITQSDGTPVTLTAPCSVFAGTPETYPHLIKVAGEILRRS